MAKSLKQQQAQIGKEFDELAKLQNEWDKLLDRKKKGLKIDEDRLKFLEKEHGSYNRLAKVVDGLSDKFNNYNKKIEESNKNIAESVQNFEDVEETIHSIGFGMAKNEKLQGALNDKIQGSKLSLKGISSILQDQNDLSQSQINNADEAADAYKNIFRSIGESNKLLKRGEINQKDYNDTIDAAYKDFDNLIDNIDTTTESGKQLKAVFDAMRNSIDQFGKAAAKSNKHLGAMDAAMDELGSSGIPLARELSNGIKDIAKSGKLGKAALIALGAAAGKLAYDYFGAGVQASIKASMDVKENQIEGAKNVAQAQNELAFAARKASQDFRFELQQMAAQFRAASKTAFFGKGLGSVGYAADKLMLAGISAETIVSATTAASKAGSGSAKLAADMAIFAERSGISVDNVADIQQTFKLLDKVAAKTALNMVEGTRAMAEQAGLNVGDIMNEVASASQMALEAHVQSGKALARQVIYAKSLGVSFQDVAKAGQNMVLNYKDSIKAEMSLSAMLGKNVNLSEVRAKFMAGDQEGALKALKAQGLKPSEMNMFQKQQLQQALGGMDLNTLEKIGTPGYQEDVGKLGSGENLAASNAKAANDAFLALKMAAEGGLRSDTAIIQANQAIADAPLQTEIANAWLNSPAYTNYLAEMTRLDKERALKENAGGAIAAVVGGVLTSFLTSKMTGTARKNLVQGAAKSAKFAKFTKGTGVVGSIVGAGFDYKSRKDEGQTTKQAAAGVGGGLAGAALGAKGGASAGAAIGALFGGVGAAPGALIGGLIGGAAGYFLGGKAADAVTGAGKKPTVAGNRSPEIVKTETKPTVEAVKHSTKVTESVKKTQETAIKEIQYTGKIQNEMVALLATNAQLLEEIMNNTANERTINLSGKKVNSTLLNQNRKTYGIAKS